jgi:hypothetical protein
MKLFVNYVKIKSVYINCKKSQNSNTTFKLNTYVQGKYRITF